MAMPKTIKGMLGLLSNDRLDKLVIDLGEQAPYRKDRRSKERAVMTYCSIHNLSVADLLQRYPDIRAYF